MNPPLQNFLEPRQLSKTNCLHYSTKYSSLLHQIIIIIATQMWRPSRRLIRHDFVDYCKIMCLKTLLSYNVRVRQFNNMNKGFSRYTPAYILPCIFFHVNQLVNSLIFIEWRLCHITYILKIYPGLHTETNSCVRVMFISNTTVCDWSVKIWDSAGDTYRNHTLI